MAGINRMVELIKNKVFRLVFCSIISLISIFVRAESLKFVGTLWSPYMEWNIKNPTYSDNPFDLIATVTFTHENSGKKHITEMFYKGGDIWSFRFTGTKTGIWNFKTESPDPDLNGRSGTISIYPNQDPLIRGFLGSQNNKFTIDINENKKIGYLFNIYTNNIDELQEYTDKIDLIDLYLNEAEENGFSLIFIFLANNCFKLGVLENDQHDSENPDLETFALLDEFITKAHQRGMRVHFWAWGDASRGQTPYGGINGIPDRRLQRYIAARLGPLPGWSLGYGYDLEEWISESEIGSWAEYLHGHMGWPHFLMGRGRDHPELDAVSHSGLGPRSYLEIVNDLDSDPLRPHVYSERDLYLRNLNMDETRTQLWTNAMAGGMGGFWGIYWEGEEPYPNPEQLITYRDFWRNRFLLDFEKCNNLTDGFGLKDTLNQNFVFYKENTHTIQIDLRNINLSLQAVAVQTDTVYNEIDLGLFGPNLHTIELPADGDWVIALGNYSDPTKVTFEDGEFIGPNIYHLNQNYPNPFNSNTKITFTLSKSSKVSLSVYNILGENVFTFVNQYLFPGIYNYVWWPDNMATGTYYYNLKVSNYSETKKMILLK